MLNGWLLAVIMIFFFNFCQALFPGYTYFDTLERGYRFQAFYKGIPVCYMQVVFCALMNLINMHYDNQTLILSASLGIFFFVTYPSLT